MVAQEAGTAPTIFARTLRDIISRIFLHCILKGCIYSRHMLLVLFTIKSTNQKNTLEHKKEIF